MIVSTLRMPVFGTGPADAFAVGAATCTAALRLAALAEVGTAVGE